MEAVNVTAPTATAPPRAPRRTLATPTVATRDSRERGQDPSGRPPPHVETPYNVPPGRPPSSLVMGEPTSHRRASLRRFYGHGPPTLAKP